MSIFRWNPIRRLSDDEGSRREYSTGPVTYVPRNYVLQRKRWLYNNLFVLLAGLLALTISHDVDIFNTAARLKLKKFLVSVSLCFGHLVAVPLTIGCLRLHYSIVVGAMGMGVGQFFYYVGDPVALSVVISLRAIFEALFDVAATIYVVRLARVCSSIQGNAVFTEILTMHSLMMVFNCAAGVGSVAWQRYTGQLVTSPDANVTCDTYLTEGKSFSKENPDVASAPSPGQSTMLVAVAIVVALSGVILIALYLKPITSLDDSDLSREVHASRPWRVLKQFKKRKSAYLAILISISILMYSMTDELIAAYVTCRYPRQYGFFIVSAKQIAVIFGVLTSVSVVDLTGCRWLYTIALSCQMLSYVCLVFWNPSKFNMEISFLVIYHVMCTSIGIEISVNQLLVVQTIIDEEVSAWCFFYVLGDIAFVLRLVSDVYLCTGTKLWLLVGLCPIAVVANFAYWHRFDENVTTLTLYGSCSQLIRTPRETLAKPSSFNLKIVVESPRDIRKVETFLQRDYTLKSRHLVPPPDDEFSSD